MRSQRLLKVHRLNPTPLQPALSNGIIIWTPSALFLHFLWAWQFIIVACVEAVLLMLLNSDRLQSLKLPLLLLATINTALCTLPVLETCLYANLGLTSTRYVSFQAVKSSFYTAVFALRCVWFQGWCISSVEGVRKQKDGVDRDDWYIFSRVLEVALFLPPFILALIYSVVLRRRERAQAATQKPGAAPDRITVVITPADEETRLLQ